MKVSVKLPKKLISIWKKELTNKTDCYKKTKVNRQTINKAIKTGKCTRSTMDKVNSYLLKQRNDTERNLNKLCK